MFIVGVSLLVSVLVIYYSCELFVNGIEWVGKKFNVAQSAVGSVLAAFGTALPESAVTLVAVAFNASAEQKDIGVGAALGGPLVLGTIAYAVVGACLIYYRRKQNLETKIEIDGAKLSRDQLWFVSIFVFKIALGLFIFSWKPFLGIFFLLAYALYFYKEMSAKRVSADDAALEPLKFRPKQDDPSTFWVILQTTFALVLIFASSHLFVKNLEAASYLLNVPPLIVALLLSPVATELPEILNTVIWVRQGKETLALGNISGAMMIQATVPSALGIFFTPWYFDAHLIWSGVVTLMSVLYLLITFKQHKLFPQRLMYAGIFYLIFAAIFLIR